MRKGIILAGGDGTRLYPNTIAISKHLLSVYDKPMIYYSLSTLMLANIREILIICKKDDLKLYKKLLNDGSKFGIKLSYKIQDKPNGIAEALIIAKNFLKNSPCVLILGDNIFYGPSFQKILLNANKNKNNATVFSYYVKNPSDYGIINFNKNKIISIEEKPVHPKSHYALTGLYFYPKNVANIAKKLKPSERKELEITDLNNIYLKNKKLSNIFLGRGFTWLDAGNIDSLFEASLFIKTLQSRQGSKICCPEEIALKKKFISPKILEKSINKIKSKEYRQYVLNIMDNA